MNQTTQCQEQAQVKTNKNMKKLIILILISLWAFVDAKAQSNYFISSVGEVEITETGSGLLSGQTKKDTSEVATSQRFWFLSPKGFDQGSGNWFQAGLLNVELKNLSSTQWKKVTLYDFTGTNILYVENIAPNAIISFDFGNNKRLDASKDYYWKFEDITSQSVVCNNDTKVIAGSSFEYIDVLDNDKNLPSGADCRLKAGQNLTGGITVTKDQFTGLKVSTSNQQGSFSFVYEVVLNGTVLGEATATVTVGNASQYCTLAILSEQLQVGSQTIHEFTLYSPNAQINPFNYTVRTGSFTGTIVKSGTTPPATSSKEIIDFGTLPTGTYYVTFSSTVSECFDLRAVSHIASNDACNTSIISIDKLNGTNNYSVNSPFSNVTSIKAYLTSAEVSVGVPLLSQTNITTPAFNLNLTTLQTGTYYLNIEGEGKFCKAQKVFEHTLVEVTSGVKLETWTKFIHNYKDNWIISGKNDYESGRDKFGLQTFSERGKNVVWKTFISDFENLGNSPRAKAIVGFRKDTTRNEVGISVAVTPNSIILQQRLTKSGTTNVLATVNNITMPVWVKLTKTGNDLVADFSKDLTMTPVYQELGRVNGVFSGWSNYQKYIGVASAKTDVIATARFQGQLGGKVNFASPTVIINPPVIASNIINPSSGQSLTLSTSTACIAPSTNRWYKNTQITSFSSGSTVNVQGFNGDSYYARCENGLNKSIASNVVSFTISNLVSCNNGTNPFTVESAVYNNGSISFSFNASNLSNVKYSVLNGSTVITTSTVQPTSNTVTVPTTTLSAGNYIFKLDGISCNGSAQKSFTVSGAGSTPVITSLPASPVAGDNVTMTATGCVGNYNWYASGASQAYATNSGSSTVNGVAGGTYYYATCIGSNVPSNYVNIGSITTNSPPTGGVTITEPNKPQYFFSNNQAPSFYNNRANLPAIITNTATFDAVNDVVKLKNSDVEFWFNLRRGGQICYASKTSTPINRVYNGYDGGFQWVYDAAQYLVDGKLNGSFPDQTNNNVNYNTTMGGDFQNNSQTLIDYHPVGNNGYYFKFRPILYNFIARVAEVEMEVTYTLIGKSLKADYKYTSFRTDQNIERNNPFRFMGFHVPICFLTNNFTKYSIYTGNSPWTNGGMTEGDIPNVTGGIARPLGFNTKEFMGISFDPSNGFAVGVLKIEPAGYAESNVTYEQLNKYSGGSTGTVFGGPYTTMALSETLAIPNGGNFERSSSVYFTLGQSVQEVRNELREKAGF